MSTAAKPFVTQLRTRGTPVALAPDGSADAITIRVEVPEIWDTQAFVVRSSESVVSLKQQALAHLYPQSASHEDFVLKFRGWEVLDEQANLATLGVQNGSILLLTHRRRRAVK